MDACGRSRTESTPSEVSHLLLLLSAKTTVPMPRIAQEAIGILRLAVAISALMSPIRLQGTRLHWDDNMVYLQGTITDRAPTLGNPWQPLCPVSSHFSL